MLRTWLVACFDCSAKCSHFLRDHGKTLSLLAGLGGLDRRVDRQKIGLRRQVLDGRDDLADRLRLLAQAHGGIRDGFHLMTDTPDSGDRFLGALGAALRNLRHVHGVFGNGPGLLAGNLGGLTDFLDGGRGLD